MYDQKDETTIKNERGKTLHTWHEKSQDHTATGQWTKKLITNFKSWTECKHKKINYYLTQVLIRHGVFRRYAKRLGKVAVKMWVLWRPGQRTSDNAKKFCRDDAVTQISLGRVTYHDLVYNEKKGRGKTETAEHVAVDSKPWGRTTGLFHDVNVLQGGSMKCVLRPYRMVLSG